MKKGKIVKLCTFGMLIVMMMSLCAITNDTAFAAKKAKDKVTVTKKKNTLYVGNCYQVKVKEKKCGKLKYKTSNKKVGTVNSKGLVTAKKVGTAVITVSKKANTKVKSKCKIQVKKAPTSGTYNGLTWKFNEVEKTISISGAAGKLDENLVIPETINGFPVTEIGMGAFINHFEIQKVSMPKTLNKINDGAFDSAWGIQSISVNSKNECFSSDNGVLFNKDKTSLLIYPASKAGITYQTPESVKKIESKAFALNDSLESIYIGKNVNDIGYRFAYKCNKLESVNIDTVNPTYSSLDGVLFDLNKTKVIYYPTGKRGDTYTIPDSVTTVGNASFEEALYLSNINFNVNTKTVEDYAFYQCKNLNTINFKNKLESIGNMVFWNCNKLDKVKIPDSVTSIGIYSFNGCSNLTLFVGEKSYALQYAKDRGIKYVIDYICF